MLHRGKENIRRPSRYIDRKFGFCSRGVINKTQGITMSQG